MSGSFHWSHQAKHQRHNEVMSWHPAGLVANAASKDHEQEVTVVYQLETMGPCGQHPALSNKYVTAIANQHSRINCNNYSVKI